MVNMLYNVIVLELSTFFCITITVTCVTDENKNQNEKEYKIS